MLLTLWFVAVSLDDASAHPMPDASALMTTARELVAAGPAAQGSVTKDAVREYILARLELSSATTKPLPFRVKVPRHGRWHLTNVIASFNPDARRRVMIGGHWDTRPWADEDPDPAKRHLPVQGANDGVSSTAVLLEVADTLDGFPLPPDFGVDIVFFDGEEGPRGTSAYYLGSKHLATRWTRRTGLARPEAGVVVDMVGRKGQNIKREGYSEKYARVVNDELFTLATARQFESFSDAPGQWITDDHRAFNQRNMPVALLIDIDDPAWHTTNDVIENLDGKAMAEVAALLIAWIQTRSARAL